jgi:hypothetical protein
MWLDTMCNTFGGVCFIALLICIISANLPKMVAQDLEPDVKKIEQSQELKDLQRKKDELQAAVKAQNSLLTNQTTNGVAQKQKDIDAARTKVATNSTRKKELEDAYQSLLKEIASLGADVSRNNRECDRLSKLKKVLGAKLADLKTQTTQVGRAPMEHSTSKRPLHLIFQKGRAAVLNWEPNNNLNDKDFVLKTTLFGWFFSPKPRFGMVIDSSFPKSDVFKKLLQPAKGDDYYVNLVTDEFSFLEVCLVRDALLKNHVEYGWQFFPGFPIRYGAGGSSSPQ